MTAVDDLRDLVAEMAGRIGDLEGENVELRDRVTALEGELRGAAEWATEQREREELPGPIVLQFPPDGVVWQSPEWAKDERNSW